MLQTVTVLDHIAASFDIQASQVFSRLSASVASLRFWLSGFLAGQLESHDGRDSAERVFEHLSLFGFDRYYFYAGARLFGQFSKVVDKISIFNY